MINPYQAEEYLFDLATEQLLKEIDQQHGGALVEESSDSGEDYVLKEGHNCWIRVGHYSVRVRRVGQDEEGVSCEIFIDGQATLEPLESCSVTIPASEMEDWIVLGYTGETDEDGMAVLPDDKIIVKYDESGWYIDQNNKEWGRFYGTITSRCSICGEICTEGWGNGPCPDDRRVCGKHVEVVQ